MNTAILILASLCGTLAMAAGGRPAAPRLEPGAAVTLGVGEEAASRDGRVAVTFVAVSEDSRCPEGVQCIWAGNARVLLRIREDGNTREAALCSNAEPRQVRADGLTLRFVALEPHPRKDTAIDPATYRLTIAVAQAER